VEIHIKIQRSKLQFLNPTSNHIHNFSPTPTPHLVISNIIFLNCFYYIFNNIIFLNCFYYIFNNGLNRFLLYVFCFIPYIIFFRECPLQCWWIFFLVYFTSYNVGLYPLQGVKWTRKKLINIPKGHSKKKIHEIKLKHAYIAGGENLFTLNNGISQLFHPKWDVYSHLTYHNKSKTMNISYKHCDLHTMCECQNTFMSNLHNFTSQEILVLYL
jgi:hypothetical protein